MEIADTKNTVMNMLQKWPKLIEWLEEKEYFIAPASIEHHGAYRGGLLAHSIQVGYELMHLTSKLGLKWERKESPMIIGLLHDVCKLDDYDCISVGDNTSIEWKKDDALYPGHGEKSLIMLMGYIALTEEEKMCIRYHMGAFTDKKEWSYYTRAVKRYPNVLWTHTADMIASQIKGV
nr:MAG TPA: Putative helicase [Caudoviricetes sp.]